MVPFKSYEGGPKRLLCIHTYIHTYIHTHDLFTNQTEQKRLDLELFVPGKTPHKSTILHVVGYVKF